MDVDQDNQVNQVHELMSLLSSVLAATSAADRSEAKRQLDLTLWTLHVIEQAESTPVKKQRIDVRSLNVNADSS
jgi:hypothetical protein